MRIAFFSILILALLPAAVLAGASVDLQADKAVISLSNGIRMEALLSGGELRGIGKVWFKDSLLKDDSVLQSPQVELALPGRTYAGGGLAWGTDPLSEADGAQNAGGNGDYSRCELASARAQGEKVILTTRLGEGEVTDELVWEILPHSTTIKGVKFEGFGYTYRFKSAQRPLFTILDTFSWGPGGGIDGTWILESGHSQGYTVKKKLSTEGDILIRESPEAQFKIYPQLYDLSHPTPLFNYTHFDFRFQFGDGGLLFAYNRYPTYGLRKILKSAGSPAITYQHRYFYSREKQAETPEMIVLFTPELKSPTPLQVEDWHGIVYDYVHARRCEHYGVKPPEMLTMASKAWLQCMWPDSIRDNHRYLEKFADWGFQAIWWKGWEDNHDNRRLGSIDYMMNLRPGAALGGEDAAKEFCDRAHELGLKVYCWCPTFYTGGRSLYAAQHPEWLLRDSDGQYQYKRYASSDGNVKSYGIYTELVAYDLNSGYQEHFLRSYRHLRELGIDGVWMDSYPNITVDCIPYRSPDEPIYDNSGVYRLTAELMKMGLQVGYEGSGPLGIPMGGTVTPIIDDRAFGYQRVYGWQKLFWARGYVQEDELTKNFYYMSCANKIPAAIVAGAGPDPIERECPPKLAEWIISANKDYKQVYKHMQYRRLIPEPEDPEQEMAVEWTNDAGKTMVLWSYKPFDYQVKPGARVRNVTTGRDVPVTGNAIRTEEWHTYLIQL